jgi:small nuclear ribonucleoprotein (snRNP)-like protein
MKMSNIMEFTITIKNENGEEIVVKKCSREVPFVEEIEAKGFLDAFDDYETAVLELTKETRNAAT